MDNTEEFRCLNLCTGYAGIELGLKRAIRNLRTIAYVEVEAFAAANLVAKMEANLLDAAPVWTDIKTFPAEYFRKRVHIITAGYPCQPFSCAGKRKGTDDPRHLWPHIERIIKAVKPVWFFGENVSGHLAIGFPEVYRSLRNMGYKVEAGLFTAAECGAPHRRTRLFILADNECAESRSGVIKEISSGIRRDRFAISSTNMANTTAEQIQGAEPEGATQTGRQIDEQGIKWPARPGQPQYEWEEPRVVGDAKCRTCGARRAGQSAESTQQRNQGQAQSRLGRAADGTRSRVDRLRLLGNGVVPQQAEKAFRELMRLFE